jgi:outer membrane protein assembly factor BamB
VTTDPNKDKVLYVFDWGDGKADTTGLIKSGDTITTSHAWVATGVFPVKVKAKDEKGKWSVDWSDTLNVTVDTLGPPNHAPDAPLKPTHTGVDSIGVPIVFTTSATDPDADSVRIKFYFGDGGTPSYGPKVASGATFTDTVIYNTNGWKVVYAGATDGRDTSALSAPDSILIHSPNVAPGIPVLVTNLMPMRGIAGGPAYRLYARASDQYGDSVYYKWYADGSEVATSAAFPSGVDAYALWTPTGDTHTYTLSVRVYDVTGLTNDSMPATSFKTVAEGEIIWGITAEFVASPAIGTTLWRGNTWPAIICGNTDEVLDVVDAYQSFLANQITVLDPWDYNSSPTIGTNGTRYVGNENGWFYAIGPDDTYADSIKWQFGNGDDAMSATAALGSDGSVYCGGDDRKLHKLTDNGATVTEVWSYSLRNNLVSSPAIGPDGKIVCCDDSGYVYSLNDNGGLNWEIRTTQELNTGIHSSPAIASDGTVYVGTEAGFLLALKDGSIVWSYETNPRFAVSSSPIIGPDGNVYFGCDDGNLYRIDQNTHLPAANWPIAVSSGAVSSSPLLCADNIIYVAGDDSLYAYDVTNPTGGRRWALEMSVPGFKGAGHRPRRLSFDDQPSAVVDQYGIIYVTTESGDGGIFAIAGRSGGTLAATDWPMFHHDAKHTGRFGAR